MDKNYLRYLSPPPRAVPFAARCNVIFGTLQGFLGWMFLLSGLVALLLVRPEAYFASLAAFNGDLTTTDGTVMACEETNMEENDEMVYEIGYTFIAANGGEYTGTSYSTGKYYDTMDPVTIEYRKDDPSVSRIKGLRDTPFSPLILFVLVFPTVGLITTVLNFKKGLGNRRLLRNGVIGTGVLIGKKPTSTRVNNQIVYELTFEFGAEGNSYTVKAKTHQPHQLEDEEEELLFFDPEDPSKAVLLDGLPGAVTISDGGKLVCEKPGRGYLSLIFPAVAVCLGAVYLLTLF